MRKKWEYKKIICRRAELDEYMDERYSVSGAEGWELVSVIEDAGADPYTTAFFKREIID